MRRLNQNQYRGKGIEVHESDCVDAVPHDTGEIAGNHRREAGTSSTTVGNLTNAETARFPVIPELNLRDNVVKAKVEDHQ
mmetsp:Transcript_28030/g.54642  ORF Transcript_28030/g.54642 Transcript_28030/m.54642 type:complete len:80 (-) Transcript_28030:504-743(-)